MTVGKARGWREDDRGGLSSVRLISSDWQVSSSSGLCIADDLLVKLEGDGI